jgi:adenine-specific DNA-methyltransferase
MKSEILKVLKKTLMKDSRLVSNKGKFMKNISIELIKKMDQNLLKLLLEEKAISDLTLTIVDTVILDVNRIIEIINYIDRDELQPDSYTKFGSKINLVSGNVNIKDEQSIVLEWPYKDGVLKGGMSSEDEGMFETVHHEILGKEFIDNLRVPKVLTNIETYPAGTSFDPDGNLLIKGNNLIVAYSLLAKYKGKIKLEYFDIPYNTENEQGYNDKFKHSTWLTFMKNRLEVAKELLSKDGSIWVQIDDNEHAYLKVLMDEIFGRENFRANIVWQRKYTVDNNTNSFSKNTDYILVYSKTELFQINGLERTDKNNKNYKHKDAQGIFRSDNFIHGYSKDRNYTIVNPNTKKEYNPPVGKGWRATKEEYLKMLENDEIFFGVDGTAGPSKKKYLDNVGEVTPSNIWTYEEVNHTDGAKKELMKLFSDQPSNIQKIVNKFTPKPEKLIQRIIHLASNPGDIVLDLFGGSGTTAAVAHKMGRKWILAEQMNYIKTITHTRLEKVINGEQGGISEDAKWQGGGSFTYCELAENSQKIVSKISELKDEKSLMDYYHNILNSLYLDWRVVMGFKTEEENKKDFEALDFDSKKATLIKLINKNSLYRNINEEKLDDFNKKFYNK